MSNNRPSSPLKDSSGRLKKMGCVHISIVVHFLSYLCEACLGFPAVRAPAEKKENSIKVLVRTQQWRAQKNPSFELFSNGYRSMEPNYVAVRSNTLILIRGLESFVAMKLMMILDYIVLDGGTFTKKLYLKTVSGYASNHL